jgi:hypothetical protein
MRVLLILVAILLAAAPAAAERPRTGWNGQAGFSHYFPLSPEERARLLPPQQAQRAGIPGDVFVPQSGASGGGAQSSCGWAGCAQGAAGGWARGPQAVQTPQVCGWAGCRRDGAAQTPQSRTDVCGWAGCRGASSAAPAFAGGGEAGFRDRCGWAGCR